MYEKSIARKLGLGINFTRKTLHGIASAMGMIIVAPKTAIAALSLKLHLSHRLMQSENGKIINLIEKNQIIETDSGGKDSIACKTNNYGTKLWIENAKKFRSWKCECL